MKRLIRKSSIVEYYSIWTRGYMIVVQTGQVGERAVMQEFIVNSEVDLMDKIDFEIASVKK